jgi:HlyD family type I secretion membrane fusion protein
LSVSSVPLENDVAAELASGLGRNTGISSRVVWGTLFATLLIAGIGGWAATSELSGAVVGQGQIKVDKDLRAIQHIDGGIIRKINVRKGDVVTERQILFQLDDAVLKSERQILQGQLTEYSAKRLRLLAERDNMKAIPALQGEDALGIRASKEIENETRLFHGNLERRASQIEQLKLGIVQIEQELKGLNAQKDSNSSELTLVESEADKVDGLKRKGLIEGTRVFNNARDLTKLRGEGGQIEASIARSLSRKNEIELQILAVDEDARNEAQKQLSEIEPRISELNERYTAVLDRLQRLEIRSPIDGTINEITINTIGGVITPAQKLLTIVPMNAALQVEVKVQPTDIDQIYMGQDVKLRFSAFSARETPELGGLVAFISPATSTDPANGQTFYTVQVEIADGELAKLNGKKLVPGMPVESFIQTESRTALSYLLKPMIDQFRRAFREQ